MKKLIRKKIARWEKAKRKQASTRQNQKTTRNPNRFESNRRKTRIHPINPKKTATRNRNEDSSNGNHDQRTEKSFSHAAYTLFALQQTDDNQVNTIDSVACRHFSHSMHFKSNSLSCSCVRECVWERERASAHLTFTCNVKREMRYRNQLDFP